jgi:hypothetical protein
MPFLLTIFGRYVRFLMCTKCEEKPIKQPRDSCPLRHAVTRWQMTDPRCVLHAEGLVPVGSIGCMGSPTDGRGRAPRIQTAGGTPLPTGGTHTRTPRDKGNNQAVVPMIRQQLGHLGLRPSRVWEGSMPILIACPTCGHDIQLPDTLAGKPATCPQCKAAFKVPLIGSGTAAAEPTAPPSASAVPPLLSTHLRRPCPPLCRPSTQSGRGLHSLPVLSSARTRNS